MANITKVTPARLAQFFEAIRQGASVTEAAKAIGVTREHMHRLRQADPEIAAAWASAYEASTEELEAALYQKARGYWIEEPTYYRGKQEGTRRVYHEADTGAATFLLKARKPEVYRETQKVDITRTNVEVQVHDEATRIAALAHLTARLALPAGDERTLPPVDAAYEQVREADAPPWPAT